MPNRTERKHRSQSPAIPRARTNRLEQTKSRAEREQELHRLVNRFIAICVAVVGLVLGFAVLVENMGQIRQGFARFFATPTPPSLSTVVEDLLAFSDMALRDDGSSGMVSQFNAQMLQSLESCENQPQDIECWLMIGQTQAVVGNYRGSLEAYQRANELDIRLADPYYFMGNTYFDLAVLDMIRKERFRMDVEDIRIVVEPDEVNALLLEEAREMYEQGDSYPLFEAGTQQNVNWGVALDVVTRRRELIDQYHAGNPTLWIDGTHLSRPITWIPALFSENSSIMREWVLLTQNMLNDYETHPERYPSLPALSELGTNP